MSKRGRLLSEQVALKIDVVVFFFVFVFLLSMYNFFCSGSCHECVCLDIGKNLCSHLE